MSATSHAGMGAILHERGTAFRVWAPHAQSVSVIGDFNAWDAETHPLAAEQNGFWYGDVEGVRGGAEYRFSIRNGERTLSKIDPYARQVTNSVGNGVVFDTSFDWGGQSYTLPPFNELVIYELHVGSFFDEPGGKPGDFQSVVSKLDYLKRLGANVIQLMPTAEFAGDFSWGYNPAHIFAVESAYGGPNELKKLVKAAHAAEIGVILDVVYNHFGPSDLDLWQFDGWHENDGGGIYFYNDWRAETPWGATRPDYGRGEVRRFIHDNAMMWLEEFRMDGLRYDMTLYIRSVRGNTEDKGEELAEGWGLTQWINGDIRSRFPGKITVAEDLRNNSWLTKSPADGGAGFHSQWDANFVHPIRLAVTEAEDRDRSMNAVRDAITCCYNHDAFQRVIYSESHDEVANGKARVPAEVNPDDPQGVYAQKRSTLAASLVFTSPGIPMLFQGQEFLQGEWFRDDVPLDWDLRSDFKGIVRLYRDLARLRLNREGLSKGLTGQGVHVFHVNDVNNVIAFRRWQGGGPGDDVVVIANFSASPATAYVVGFPAAGDWKLRFNSDWTGYSPDFTGALVGDAVAEAKGYDGYPARATLKIAPYSLVIYSQDPIGESPSGQGSEPVTKAGSKNV